MLLPRRFGCQLSWRSVWPLATTHGAFGLAPCSLSCSAVSFMEDGNTFLFLCVILVLPIACFVVVNEYSNLKDIIFRHEFFFA
uniref:Uncharacterized protein n=1 Tax=Aegilops tauschii subsp. strangulata TaxID=200361 RepID=A0A453MQK5_AEGTS